MDVTQEAIDRSNQESTERQRKQMASALTVLNDGDQPVADRISALTVLSDSLTLWSEPIDDLLKILGDSSQPITLRREVLDVLQQATFTSLALNQRRPDYLETLRSIVDDDDTQLRHQAITILALNKDEYVQRRLIEGVQKRSRATVPVAKAIQLLGNDVHAEYFPMLRDIVQNPPSRAAKNEALRVLAADPDSIDLMTQLVADKSEHRDARTISATALQSLAPNQFETQARQIAVDTDDDEQMRALSVNALTHFGSPTLSGDSELTRHVEELQSKSSSRQVKQATRTFLSRRGVS